MYEKVLSETLKIWGTEELNPKPFDTGKETYTLSYLASI